MSLQARFRTMFDFTRDHLRLGIILVLVIVFGGLVSWWYVTPKQQSIRPANVGAGWPQGSSGLGVFASKARTPARGSRAARIGGEKIYETY